MNKLTAIILATLIVALPIYGCTFTSTINSDNNIDATDNDNSSIIQSFEENEEPKENTDTDNLEEEKDATNDEMDKLNSSKAISYAKTITLYIMECKADIYTKNDSVYDGVSTYEDAFGTAQILPKASDSHLSIDENGHAVSHTTKITIADVAGVKQINDLFKPVSYNNTEYNPYWVGNENRCLFLNAEGNSFEKIQFDMNDTNIVPLSKNGAPNSELFIHSLLELN